MASQREISGRVQQRLDSERLGPVRFTILMEGVRQEDDWWYVPVQPSEEPAKTSDYYDLLARVQTELLEEDDLNIVFIPTAPESERTEP